MGFLQGMKSGITIITAERGGGKTAFMKRIVSFLSGNGMPHTGFFADGSWHEGERSAFSLCVVPEMTSITLCDRINPDWPRHGRFRYNPAALELGKGAVERALPGEIIVMDEIGLRELRGEVWADALTTALEKKNPLLLSVRRRLVKDVMAKWSVRDARIFDGSGVSWERIWRFMNEEDPGQIPGNVPGYISETMHGERIR